MNKEEFLKLNIEDRVKYFNEKIKEVGSYNKVCKELNISTSQSGILKKHGWVRSGDKFIYYKNLDKNNVKDNEEISQQHTDNGDCQDTCLGNKQSMETVGNILTDNIDKLANYKEVSKKIKMTKDGSPYDTDKSNIKPVDNNIIKKIGRPSKPGRRKYSLNLNIADFKSLQIYCILNDITPSDVLNDLIKDFLKTIDPNMINHKYLK